MAVQAPFPSSTILLFHRNGQESKNMILGGTGGGGGGGGGGDDGGGGFFDQSHMLFNNGVGINPRKSTREVANNNNTSTNLNSNSFNYSVQNQQQTQLIDLAQLQNHHPHHANFVSTGLRLSFGDQQLQQQQLQQQQQNSLLSRSSSVLSLFSQDFAHQLKQHSDELNHFLHAQGEQLRRTIAEKRETHYRALVSAAEEAVVRRLREKSAEVQKAAGRNAELEARAAQLTAEAQVWEAQARAHEAQAASLQAQLHQAQIGGAQQQDRDGMVLACTGGGDGQAEDAESAYVDPERDRVNAPTCKVCRTRAASVVLLPCRHLCVCTACDDVVQACPLCLSLRNASVEVYLT